jgi:transketolase
LKKYRQVVTIEEGFIRKGGLDGIIADLAASGKLSLRVKSLGFEDAYVFDIGSREYLHALHHLDEPGIVNHIKALERKRSCSADVILP